MESTGSLAATSFATLALFTQLYRDGAYVGMAALPLLLPGSDVRVPFGVDERIRINVRDERAESGRRGVLNKQVVTEHRRRYEITSYHATALPSEVVDRAPVPQESDIKVEVLEGATAPTVKNLDGKEGVYLWKLPGTPRKTEAIGTFIRSDIPATVRFRVQKRAGSCDR